MEQQQNPYALILVGAVMLVLGVVVGYILHPMISAQATPLDADQAADRQQPAIATAVAVAVGTAVAETEADLAAAAPPAEPTPPPPAPADRAELMALMLAGARHFRGDPDAPVTMIEFSDFQCPFCARHWQDVGPQLDEAYIDGGQVRLAFYPLAFLGEQSLWAAEASECAAEQDAFWPYHDLLFERVSAEQRDFSRENLKAFAAELELDSTSFDACMDDERHRDTILESTSAAQSIGIRSTPTFLVDGWAVIGAQPFPAFTQVIDDQLSGTTE